MSNKVKVTMLGLSRAGKTCYLLGMYKTMQTGINGYTLAATDLNKDLELREKWEALVLEEGSDRWPPQNLATVDDSNRYNFDFLYKGKPIDKTCEWVDYRGGALLARYEEQDVGYIIKEISSSSCLFLCISSEYLNQPATEKTKIRTGSDRINYLLDKYVASAVKVSPESPFPIGIILTKYDMCKRSKEEVLLDIQKVLFPQLFQPDSGWIVMISSVSLGLALEQDEGIGEIEPIGFHSPVIFSLYSKLIQERKEEINRGNQASGDFYRLDNKKWLGRWLTKAERNSAWQTMENSQENAKKLEDEFQKLESEFLKDCIIFDSGRLISWE